MNSIEVVFIPSRREVIKARSATESRPKYSSRSIAWWLGLALTYTRKLTGWSLTGSWGRIGRLEGKDGKMGILEGGEG